MLSVRENYSLEIMAFVPSQERGGGSQAYAMGRVSRAEG